MEATPYESFEDLFSEVMNGAKPYEYQKKFAESSFLYNYISVPTGMGKTANIILGWVWRRLYHVDPKVRTETGRRLVYCLPMRSLVEQTWENTISWLDRLGILSGSIDDGTNNYSPRFEKGKVSVVKLMGGEDKTQWDIYPDRNIVIIGTQDILLSASLNRGYGISRFRWPIQFGALNNDCLWVFDEIQLMGPALETGIQLHSFRDSFGTVTKCESVWMSATMDSKWLKTVDSNLEDYEERTLKLTQEDNSDERVSKIINAPKAIKESEYFLEDIDKLASHVLDEHDLEGRTIVVVNTVEVAKNFYNTLKKLAESRKISVEILLSHSHFRMDDRQRIMREIMNRKKPTADSILVSTQIVEAGLDISCKRMFTQIAPWSSMVQRFGRCNRYGEYDNSVIEWFTYGSKDKKKESLPYDEKEIKTSEKNLKEIKAPGDVSFNSLMSYGYDLKRNNVIRKKDMEELFDTRPYISYFDTDLSGYIRNSNSHNVFVFWRNLGDPDEEPLPSKEELCTVPKNDIITLLKSSNKQRKEGNSYLYRMDWYNGKWKRINANENMIADGEIIMMDRTSGHYSNQLGWDLKSKRPVEVVERVNENPENKNIELGFNYDPTSKITWKSIAEHSEEVGEKCKEIVSDLEVFANNVELQISLYNAARWHDVGKAHYRFQDRIIIKNGPSLKEKDFFAKAPAEEWMHTREAFRHELASAIVAMNNGLDDLSCFLVMSHHGKIRMSIRSGNETQNEIKEDHSIVMGLKEGDIIPAVNLGNGIVSKQTAVRLNMVEMGSKDETNSWMKRSCALYSCHGPFVLSYLEAILRAADQRASGGMQ